MIETKSLEKTIEDFDTIINKYPEITNFEIADFTETREVISKKIEAFKKLVV